MVDKRDAIRSYAVALGICRVDLSGAWIVGFSGHEDQSHRDVVDRSEWSTPENSGAEGARQVWTGDLLCSWASEVVALIADSELYQVFFLFYSGKCVANMYLKIQPAGLTVGGSEWFGCHQVMICS